MKKITRYDDIVVFDGHLNHFDLNEFGSAHAVRLSGATDPHMAVQLQKAGFIFADRTLKVTISLSKCVIDVEKLIRVSVVETQDFKDDIYRIAAASFPYDRRFHVFEWCNAAVSQKILRVWIEEIDQALVALHGQKPIGFLVLKKTEESIGFIHLAAVDEAYRTSGAAMALYAKAIEVAKRRGYKKLQGRISSQNTAVMNIYSSFGALFSEPQDVFIKETR